MARRGPAGTLNAWLKANGGYTSANDLEEMALVALGGGVGGASVGYGGKADVLSQDSIESMLAAGAAKGGGMVLIANVMHGHHFVLAVGFARGADASGDPLIFVNDPGFERDSYPLSEVVGWRLFAINGPGASRATPVHAK